MLLGKNFSIYSIYVAGISFSISRTLISFQSDVDNDLVGDSCDTNQDR